jgi:hypothetical protein
MVCTVTVRGSPARTGNGGVAVATRRVHDGGDTGDKPGTNHVNTATASGAYARDR